MKKLINLTVKRKIFLSYFLIVFLFLLVGLYFSYPISKIRGAAREIELGSFAEIELVTSLEMSINSLDHLLFASEHTNTENELSKLRNKLSIEIKKFNVVFSEYKELVKSKPHYQQNILSLDKFFDEYNRIFEKEIIDNPGMSGFNQQKESVILSGIMKNLKELRDEAIAVLSSDLSSIDYLGTRLIKIYFFLIFLVTGVSSIIAFNLSGNISNPIKELLLAHREIGKGDFNYKIDIKNKDEFGVLQEGVMGMAAQLKYLNADLYRQKEILFDEVKKQTAAFEQTKQYLEGVANGIDEEIILLDKDYKILWVNKKMSEKAGLATQDIIGKFCFKVTQHDQGLCLVCPIKELLKTSKPVTVVHSHYDKQGNLFYAEIAVYPLRNEAGEISQFIHISRDITQRIEMESALNKSLHEMKDKINELELFHKVTIGRELKMVELKERIFELEKLLKETK